MLDKFALLQMLDVHLPTTDGRLLILSRYTQPEADQKILLKQLNLTFKLERVKLCTARNPEGRYLLRTNLCADNPERLWRCYMQLVFVEEAFRTLKGDPGLRPIYYHRADRIEEHLCVAILAYCLCIPLRQRLKALLGGLMPRVVFEKLAGLQLLDVRVPTADGRERFTVVGTPHRARTQRGPPTDPTEPVPAPTKPPCPSIASV